MPTEPGDSTPNDPTTNMGGDLNKASSPPDPPVLLSELLEFFKREEKLPSFMCSKVARFIEKIAGLVAVEEETPEALTLVDHPLREIIVDWRKPEDKNAVEVIIRRLIDTGALKPRSTIEIVRTASCLNIVLAWYVDKRNPPSQPIMVEIRNITDREQLAWEIYQKIMEKNIVKTFMVRGIDRESVLGIYCYRNGIYYACEESLEAQAERLARESGQDVAMKVTRWIVNEVMARIKRSTLHPLHREPMMLAFKNVFFDWEVFLETGRIREAVKPHDPDVVAFHRIPHRLAFERLDKLEGLIKYDEALASENIEAVAKALCPKALEAFKQWVDEKWILLFEIIGYTLYPRYDLHKAIMLVGEGSNGKSTYLRLVKDILGRDNIASISLQDLVDDGKRFVVATLYHKLANIYADLPSRALKTTGRFKILTGEDQITADRKFKDPITFMNYAKLLFSANILPRVSDMTTAFWRRWIVLEFPHRFPPDPEFYYRTFTEEEIEGVILVSLLAFRQVLKRRKFSYEESETDYKEKWLREANPVYAFIKDLLAGVVEGVVEAREDPNGRVEAKKLYDLYVKWSQMEDREALPKRVFTVELERLGYPKVKVKRTQFYKGLIVVTEEEDRGSLAGFA